MDKVIYRGKCWHGHIIETVIPQRSFKLTSMINVVVVVVVAATAKVVVVVAVLVFVIVIILLFLFLLIIMFRILDSQMEVAKAAEMIHTASLVHDDVLDASDTRRGKPSVNYLFGQRKVSVPSATSFH